MLQNPDYNQVYSYFAALYSKEKTDRISDLNNLLGIRESFCIFSEHRNGITTLMSDFARRVDGIYVDAMLLTDGSEIGELESIAGSSGRPILLDETEAFFGRLKGYESAMDYLQRFSGKRQVGLRLHPEHYQYKDNMALRGFRAVEIGKIPYEEFKAVCDAQFASIKFSFPEQFVKSAYAYYNRLGEMIWYIGEAFRLIAEKNEGLTEEIIKESMESKYMWFLKQR